MSEPTERLDISDLKNTFLECPVCIEHFNQTDRRPRLLRSCIHAFCTQCLDQLLQKEGKGQITCPICRHVEKVKGSADSLPADPLRSKLVDYIEMKKQKVKCTGCPDENEAESGCQECSLFFCKECRNAHKRNMVTRDHTVISMEEVFDQPLKSLSKGHFCQKHPKYQLEFFCSNDESLCCLTCIVVDHQGHKFQKIEEAVAPRQQELESKLHQINAQGQILQKRRQELEQRKTLIQQDKSQARSEINRQFTKLERILQSRKETLLKEVDERSQAQLALCDKNISATDQSLAMIESTDSYIKQAQQNSDAVEMLQMFPSLKQSLDGSTYQSTPDADDAKGSRLLFEPSFVSTVEGIISQTGHIIESSGAEGHSEQKDAREMQELIQNIFETSMTFKTKKQVVDGLKKKMGLSSQKTCFNCHSQTQTQEKTTCGHLLCENCYQAVYKPREICPVCKRKVKTGDTPPGEMSTEREYSTKSNLGLINIRYRILAGVKSVNGQEVSYPEVNQTAYLLDDPEGQKILSLLKVAWERRLTFQLQNSSKGWAWSFRIPHEKNLFIYWSRYFQSVRKALAELGVTEDDL